MFVSRVDTWVNGIVYRHDLRCVGQLMAELETDNFPIVHTDNIALAISELRRPSRGQTVQGLTALAVLVRNMAEFNSVASRNLPILLKVWDEDSEIGRIMRDDIR